MSKLLAAARRKWGPLPVWAWAGIAGTIGALYWRMRGGSADTGAAVQGPAVAYGGEPAYGDTSSSGGYDGGTGSGAGADTGSPAYSDDRLTKIESTLGAIEYGMANMGEHLNDPGYWGVDTSGGSSSAPESGTNPGGTDTVNPTDPASVPTKEKPPAKPGGVKWGGQTFTTKQGLGAWLASHGASYSAWAKNHAAAAKMLKGPVPKPKPAARRPAPQPASARASSRQAPTTGRGQGGARTRTPPKAKPTPRRQPPAPHGERYVAPKAKPRPKAQPRSGGGGGWA